VCGISGFIDTTGSTTEAKLRHLAQAMAGTIRHRGPDDGGVLVDPNVGLAFGFRRLAVLDRSHAGSQPMESANGRWVVIFNGEIYNFVSLRSELEAAGAAFRGTSDTEVLVEGIARWGVRRMLERANGMFAFAAWDRRTRGLVLARDRFGEKPLYYGWQGSTLLFGSELKALRAHPAFRARIDGAALGLYLRHNYVPSPYSIYEGIRKLPPGSLVRADPSKGPGQELVPEAYWSAIQVAAVARSNPLRLHPQDAADALEDALAHSIALRMVADVPVGAFLSGGIDSSTVVALMQRRASVSVQTFTIGFQEDAYNEARVAAAVAAHLGTDHTELYVTPGDAMSVIPRLPEVFDEPFADSSQIPTFLLSELTRRSVTVSLSGDGGDELFGGYSRYLLLERLWRIVSLVPAPLRLAFAGMVRRLPPTAWDELVHTCRWAVPKALAQRPFGDRVHKLADIASVGSVNGLYRQLISHWDPNSLLGDVAEPNTPVMGIIGREWRSPREMAMAIDTISYLPDDILTKVDRTSMATSLEARIPLLDPRVFELAWRLPASLKVRNGQSKWLLREVLHRHVPPNLVDGPKRGFGVPIGSWLRGPLRAWAEDLLNERLLRADGYLDADAVRERWAEHRAGTRDWKYHLWDVLMFQAWLHH
jgi:asparagine synthase (glutamine-hydrolysing)